MAAIQPFAKFAVLGVGVLLGQGGVGPAVLATVGLPLGELVELMFHGFDRARRSRARAFCSCLADELTATARGRDEGAVTAARLECERLLASFGVREKRLVELKLDAPAAACELLQHARFTRDERAEIAPLCQELLACFYERLKEQEEFIRDLLPDIYGQLLRQTAAVDARTARIERQLDQALAALAALGEQRKADQSVIAAQADALRDLAARATAPTSAPVLAAALSAAARGDTAPAGQTYAEDAERLEREAARISSQADATRREAAEAWRRSGAFAYFHSTKQALAAYRRASGLDPSHAWTWIYIARLERQAGRLEAAEQAARRGRDAASVSRENHDVAVADTELGSIHLKQGRLAEAERAYDAAHAVDHELAASDPYNASWQRGLSVSWIKLGDVRVARGDLDGALKAFEAGRNIRERLAASDPDNAGLQRDTAVSWDRVGDVRMALGDLGGALEVFEAGRGIAERLAASNSGNAYWQRDLSVSWIKLGDVRVAQGNLASAFLAFEQAVAIAERLAQSDPGNMEWQRDLSVSLTKIGAVHSARDDFASALTLLESARNIRELLAGSDPDNAEWQRGLSVSWNKLGDVRFSQRDLSGALAAYEAGQRIRERLAGSDPGNAEWQRDLIASHWRLAAVLEHVPERRNEARAHWAGALGIARCLADSGRLAPPDGHFVEELQRRLERAVRGRAWPLTRWQLWRHFEGS